MALPLSGITVIEAAAFVAGPFAGMTLAEQGARVIRVDQIGGGPDYHRWPLHREHGNSLYWDGLNKGKQSVTLDLKSSQGRAQLRTLIVKADVFITNYVPPKWVNEDRLRIDNPGLITLRITGNRDGSTAVDYTVNAATGLPYLQGSAEQPLNSVLPAWDLLCGMQAVAAIESALIERHKTNRGKTLTIALMDTALATISALGFIGEAAVNRALRPAVGNHIFGTLGRDFKFACGRRIMLVALTVTQWHMLIDIMSLEDRVASFERERQCNLNDEGERFNHREAIAQWIADWCIGKTLDEVEPALLKAKVCFGEYQSTLELLDDPRVAASALFQNPRQCHGPDYPVATSPVQGLAGEARVAPTLGADTDAVLAEFT